MVKSFILIVAFFAICETRTSKELLVTLPNSSQLIGRYLTTLSGKGILSFLGVPFAEPPINELRFKVSEKYGQIIMQIILK